MESISLKNNEVVVYSDDILHIVNIVYLVFSLKETREICRNFQGYI